jgi:uncharacterized protein (DUF433 family)
MTHPTRSVIVKSPDILSGTPVFAGTRVPIKNLLDYVRAGESVAEFLDDFPSVSRDQVDSVLALAETLLMRPSMRILLDECLPRKLKRSIVGHDVTTVQERRWSSKKNGELLRLMDGVVDVFLTSDQNLRYQQNLATISFSIIVLTGASAGRPTAREVLAILTVFAAPRRSSRAGR